MTVSKIFHKNYVVLSMKSPVAMESNFSASGLVSRHFREYFNGNFFSLILFRQTTRTMKSNCLLWMTSGVGVNF